MTSKRPTRMIRARDLTKGDVIVRDCTHHFAECSIPADRHSVDSKAMIIHELTVFDTETHDDETSLIYVSESGEQGADGWAEWRIVRVFADTPARMTEQH